MTPALPYPAARVSTLLTRQRLRREIGGDSMINTRSPS
jgi:hypothetical protein